MSNIQTNLLPITDLYTIAFLLCRGEKYTHIQRSVENGRRRVIFYFSAGVGDLIDSYFNGVECSAIGFRNSIENVKSLLFDFK